jgi:hypothetical protein
MANTKKYRFENIEELSLEWLKVNVRKEVQHQLLSLLDELGGKLPPSFELRRSVSDAVLLRANAGRLGFIDELADILNKTGKLPFTVSNVDQAVKAMIGASGLSKEDLEEFEWLKTRGRLSKEELKSNPKKLAEQELETDLRQRFPGTLVRKARYEWKDTHLTKEDKMFRRIKRASLKSAYVGDIAADTGYSEAEVRRVVSGQKGCEVHPTHVVIPESLLSPMNRRNPKRKDDEDFVQKKGKLKKPKL